MKKITCDKCKQIDLCKHIPFREDVCKKRLTGIGDLRGNPFPYEDPSHPIKNDIRKN